MELFWYSTTCKQIYTYTKLVVWVLWHINLCRSFNAISVYIYIHIQPKISKRILRKVEFSISGISFVCIRLTSFKLSYFLLQLKKDGMSSILTFSNKSVKLFTLKNRFLITAKFLHSIRMCLTVQVAWQVKHCGCGSCFKMKEWINRNTKLTRLN